MARSKFALIASSLIILAASAWADVIYLKGVLRDQGPAAMFQCGGNPGGANGGQGFDDTDFQISGYQDDEYGLCGAECNAQNGWYPPACGKIGADRTPVYRFSGTSPGKNIRSPASFYNWFHDSPQTVDVDFAVPLTQIGTSNQYSYTNRSFFPLDGKGWKDSCKGENSVMHNFAYCFEAHSRFGYQGNEVFSFTGDDDVWVYIDDRLMVDLGSLHPERSKSITLNQLQGLTPGQTYRLDFFYCERHTSYSRMQITTSLQFYCAYTDWCGQCEGNGQSCCTPDVIAQYCDDKDACTTDSCGLTTAPKDGGCVHTAVVCPKNTNQCKTSSCDKSKGCILTDVNCDDGNPCTIDSCDANVGCQHTKKTCDDGNLCTDDSCDGATGNCKNADNSARCNDNNACTTDTCSAKTGCLNSPVTCNDNSACTTDTCNPSSGCVYSKITCNDQNACTSDTCLTDTGCSFPTIPCNAPDKCTTAACDKVGGCKFTNVSCDDKNPCTVDSCSPTVGCINSPKDCDDGNACTADSCGADGNCVNTVTSKNCDVCGSGKCEFTDPCKPSICDQASLTCKVVPVKCDDQNACTTDSCAANGNKATCKFDSVTCPGSDPCNPPVCDKVKGCGTQPVVCDDSNLCTTDKCVAKSGNASCEFTAVSCPTTDLCNPASCDLKTGKCTTTPVNCDDNNACTADTCSVVGGKAVCAHEGKTCGDACNPASCNTTTGSCVPIPRVCDDNNPCTLDAPICVNGTTPQCNYTLLEGNCDDKNVCTNDFCNASGTVDSHCFHSNITCTPNICQILINCHPVNGCQYETKKCPYEGDFCHEGSCDANAGCITINKVCPSKDPGCYVTTCNSNASRCEERERDDFRDGATSSKNPGVVCPLVWDQRVKKAAISAGALAGIIIAAVVAAALIGLGGKAGYDFLQARNGAMGNVANNPLYTASAAGGNNPMYN